MINVFVDRGTKWADAQVAASRTLRKASFNSFAILDDDEPESEETIADLLNKWAHAVIYSKQPKSQTVKKAANKQRVKTCISTSEKLKNAMKSLPSDFKSLA